MAGIWIWGIAILVYATFSFWYVGVRGPLTEAEIEAYMSRLTASSPSPPAERLEVMRSFLRADDGREFFMLNLVRVHQAPVTPPGGGVPLPAREVLEGYSRPFMRALFARAGHPAYFGRAAGGYVEQWNVAPNPGWSFGAAIRYRSRRDVMELVTDPRFTDIHGFKTTAIETTFAFPTSPGFVVFGPRVFVALAVALLAALVQLLVVQLRA